MAHKHGHQDAPLETESDRMHHVTSPGLYYVIFGMLIVLTAITVGVAYIDLGWLSTPVALLIACIKASMVILYFMHVRYSNHLTWVVIIGSFVWLGVLFVLTFADYFSRGLSMT